MTENKKYVGTKGLTVQIALSRVNELFKKYDMKDSDSLYFQESIELLNNQMPDLIENNKWWLAVEDNLTSAMWKKARKEIIKK